MKNLSIFVFLFASTFLGALDNLCLKNGEEINCKIEKITPKWIKYKKATNLNGPIYNLEKETALFVKYENGEKEIFGKNKPLENFPSSASQIETKTENNKKNFALLLGGGVTKIVTDDWESDIIPSFMIGGSYTIPVNDNFSYDLGIAISKKGGEKETSNTTTELNIISIDFPLLVKVKVVPQSPFYSLFGIRTSIIVYDDYQYSYTYYTGYTTKYEDNDPFKLFSAGLIGAVGYEFSKKFNLEIRFDYGISDLINDDDIGDSHYDRAVWGVLGINF